VYKEKTCKKVLLLDTRRPAVRIDDNEKIKPKTAQFFKETCCATWLAPG
jgi:hypothetical protein